MVKIEKMTRENIQDLITLSIELWDCEYDEIKEEYESFLNDKNNMLFLLKIDNQAIGFTHVCLRYEYVEDCDYSPAGYLEGIYIKEKYRRKGYGRMLVEKCKDYAKENNCIEFASDCELDNIDSYYFHIACGFKEVNRNIHFKMMIGK